MKKVFLPLIMSLFLTNNVSFCQESLLIQNRKNVYQSFTGDVVFIKLKQKIILNGKPSKIDDSSIIFKDSMFTKDDIVWIKKQIILNQKFSWSEVKIKNVKVIEEPKTASDFQEKYINKYPCGYAISVPLFSIDMQKCIFYYGYSCGGLSGEGVLAIYKKVNGT